MNSEHHSDPAQKYPVGRGYGHDYMRGGEVFGGYGYSEREEYELTRGLQTGRLAEDDDSQGDRGGGGDEVA